jgi:hypothetical protein
MDDETTQPPGELLDPEGPQEAQGDGPRWHIVQMVPLPALGQPTQPLHRESETPEESSPPALPAGPPPLRPTHEPSSRPLWGDLDALLAAGPLSQSLGVEALQAEAAKRRAARRRRQLMRRLRWSAIIILLAAVLGVALWRWGPGLAHRLPHLHVGSSGPVSQTLSPPRV